MFLLLSLAPSRAAASMAFSFQSSPRSNESTSQELARETREAAGEDDTGQFKHSPSVQWVSRISGLSLERSYQLCVIVNFAVIAILIFWAMKKNLPAMFRKRTEFIRQAMEEARKASEDATRRLSEIESRLSKLDIEIGQMKSAAEKESLEEERKIKAAAEQDARKIVEAAEQEIAAAAKVARRDLRAYAADLAVGLASKQIHVDANTDQALVNDFAHQLSGNGGDQRKGRQ